MEDSAFVLSIDNAARQYRLATFTLFQSLADLEAMGCSMHPMIRSSPKAFRIAAINVPLVSGAAALFQASAEGIVPRYAKPTASLPLEAHADG